MNLELPDSSVTLSDPAKQVDLVAAAVVVVCAMAGTGAKEGDGTDTVGVDTDGTDTAGVDTDGTDTVGDGTDTVGVDTDGTDTVGDGTDTVGVDTDGTDTVGVDTDGTDTVGVDTDGTDTVGDGTDTVGDGTDTVGDGTDTVGDGTDTVGVDTDGTDTVGDGTDTVGDGTDTVGDGAVGSPRAAEGDADLAPVGGVEVGTAAAGFMVGDATSDPLIETILANGVSVLAPHSLEVKVSVVASPVQLKDDSIEALST
jgi:hypothetical protein